MHAFFKGIDFDGNDGLWITHGTAARTHEITVNGAASDGLNPTNFIVFSHHQLLFSGVNAAGERGLWVTDGTFAGTHEIAGIREANSNGLAPADLTTLHFARLLAHFPAGTGVEDFTVGAYDLSRRLRAVAECSDHPASGHPRGSGEPPKAGLISGMAGGHHSMYDDIWGAAGW